MYYKENVKTWFKHGSFDKNTHNQIVKRVTIWFLFVPIFWYETIQSHNI